MGLVLISWVGLKINGLDLGSGFCERFCLWGH